MGGRNRSQTYDKPLFEDSCGAAVLGRGIRQVARERHVLVEFVERIEIWQRGQLAAGARGQEEEQGRDNREQFHGSAAHFHRDWTTGHEGRWRGCCSGQTGRLRDPRFCEIHFSGFFSAISVASSGIFPEVKHIQPRQNTW